MIDPLDLGQVVWYFLSFAMGTGTGFLLDERRWRRQRRADAADTAADRLGAAAAPLRAALADTEAVLRQYAADAPPRSHASVLTEDGPRIDRALLPLRDVLPTDRFDALQLAVDACTDQEAKADRQEAIRRLAAARELLTDLVH